MSILTPLFRYIRQCVSSAKAQIARSADFCADRQTKLHLGYHGVFPVIGHYRTHGYIVTSWTRSMNPWLLGSCPSAAYHVLLPKACNIVCLYWNLINDQGPTVILANCKHIRNTLVIREASTASKWYPCTLIATFCNTTFAHNSTKIHTCRSFASLQKTTLTSAHQKRVLPDTL